MFGKLWNSQVFFIGKFEIVILLHSIRFDTSILHDDDNSTIVNLRKINEFSAPLPDCAGKWEKIFWILIVSAHFMIHLKEYKLS